MKIVIIPLQSLPAQFLLGPCSSPICAVYSTTIFLILNQVISCENYIPFPAHELSLSILILVGADTKFENYTCTRLTNVERNDFNTLFPKLSSKTLLKKICCLFRSHDSEVPQSNLNRCYKNRFDTCQSELIFTLNYCLFMVKLKI